MSSTGRSNLEADCPTLENLGAPEMRTASAERDQGGERQNGGAAQEGDHGTGSIEHDAADCRAGSDGKLDGRYHQSAARRQPIRPPMKLPSGAAIVVAIALPPL